MRVTLFSQIISLLQRDSFRNIVRQKGTDKHNRGTVGIRVKSCDREQTDQKRSDYGIFNGSRILLTICPTAARLNLFLIFALILFILKSVD